MMDSYENLNACQINPSNHLNYGTPHQSEALYEQLKLEKQWSWWKSILRKTTESNRRERKFDSDNDHDENPFTGRPLNQIEVKESLVLIMSYTYFLQWIIRWSSNWEVLKETSASYANYYRSLLIHLQEFCSMYLPCWEEKWRTFDLLKTFKVQM